MKILHINGTNHGGAAIAVERIHESLINKGIESHIYLPFKKDLKNIVSTKTIFGEIFNTLKPSIVRRINKILGNPLNESFSISIFPSDILNVIKEINPEIVNLHWIGNEIISLKNISQISCPIVWTLHDMWPFLGTEHYSNNSRYIEGYTKQNRDPNEKGFDLNKWNWNRKLKYFKKNFTLVSPSDWLLEKAKESHLLKEKEIEKINVPIDINEWKPIDKDYAKKIVDLDPSKKIILFGAIDGHRNFRKGFDLLMKSISRLNDKSDIQFLTFGKKLDNEFNFKNIQLKNYSHISDNLTLRLLYSAADVCLIPSRYESFGQVALESISCGTPCVSFKNTGTNEIIDHKVNGYLAKYEDIDDFKDGINFILNNNSINFYENCISKAKNFSYEKISDKYINLYKRILK
jgi:glycosyltransferase involved in cell wall biosynthesis